MFLFLGQLDPGLESGAVWEAVSLMIWIHTCLDYNVMDRSWMILC